MASGQEMGSADSPISAMLGPWVSPVVGLGWMTTTLKVAVSTRVPRWAFSSKSLVLVGHLCLESGLVTPSPSKKISDGDPVTTQSKVTHPPRMIWLSLTSKDTILGASRVGEGGGGVEVGGMRVDVGGIDVDVGGTPVAVGGGAVTVGGTSVDVGVAVGTSPSTAVGLGSSPGTTRVTGSDWVIPPS